MIKKAFFYEQIWCILYFKKKYYTGPIKHIYTGHIEHIKHIEHNKHTEHIKPVVHILLFDFFFFTFLSCYKYWK